MVKPSRLYDKLVQSPRQIIDFRDFERLLAHSASFMTERLEATGNIFIREFRAPFPCSPPERTPSAIRFGSFLI